MSVGHKQPCPCGSGKKYKHCHMERDLERRRRALWLALAVVAVAGAAFLVLQQRGRNRVLPAPLTRTQTTATGAAGARTATATTSTQMQVVTPGAADSAAPRDWSGTAAPPAAPRASGPVPGVQPRVTVTRTPDPARNVMSRINQPAPVAVDQTPMPDGRTPPPYYYDAAKNRHWDPSHSHWHPGRPPSARPASGGTAAPTPPPATR